MTKRLSAYSATRRPSFKYLVTLDQEIEIGVKRQCCVLLDGPVTKQDRNASFSIDFKSETPDITITKRLIVPITRQPVTCISFAIDEREIESKFTVNHFIAIATFSANVPAAAQFLRPEVSDYKIKITQPAKVVFLSTDKNIYQPGQVVHYKILVLFTQLKLFNGNCTVSLYNPAGIMVDQLFGQTISKGFHTGTFTLSQFTTIGLWSGLILPIFCGDAGFKSHFKPLIIVNQT